MKVMRIVSLLLIFSLIMSACGKNEIEKVEDKSGFTPQFDWPVADFSAVNQDGQKVALNDLSGKVWIMDMIFTNCDTVCLPMTANMAKLQKKLKDKNVDIEFISFSVDPSVDTPLKLQEYGKQYEADFSNWNMLTGYSEEEIKRIAKSVKTLAEKPSGTNQVTHSTKFFLINENGIALKSYDGVNLPIDEIIQDLKSLKE
jgi:protein SCO1